MTDDTIERLKMQYKVNKQSFSSNKDTKGRVEVAVEIPTADFDAVYKETVQAFSKDVNVDGFRPGTAPEGVIEAKVGANRILNEAASFLISKNLSEIFKKEDFVPIDSPKVAIGSLSKGTNFSFTATFTLRPVVKVGNWKGIKVKKVEAKAIEDADVNDSIKNIFDAWVKQEGEKVSQVSQVSQVPQVSNEEGKFIYDAKGNKVHFSSEKQTLRSSSLDELGTAGLKIPIVTEGKNKITVHKIDDEFAKAIGARDVAHLREIVRKDLENIITDQVEAKFEQDIFDEILKIGEIEVPGVLVDDELNRILIRLNTELERQEKTLEKYLEEEKTTIDELKAKWREQAAKNVKISLIMDSIGREEKVQVTKEDLAAAISGVDQSKMSAEQKRDLENYLVMSIFQARTLDLVKKAITA